MMLSCLLNDTDLPREYREASPKLPIPRDLEIFTWESSTTPDTTPSPGADSSSADNNYGSSESTVSASTLSTPSPPANPVVFVPQNAAAVTSTPPCTSVSGAQPQKQEYLHPFHFQQQQQMKHQQDQSQQYQYQHQEQRQYTPPLTTSAPNTFPSPSPPPFLAPPSNGATGQQAFLDPTQYMSPELHSLLLPVSTTAARWDAFFPLIDSSVPTPAHIATQLKLLVGRDAETLYRRYKAAPPPITYKAQAIRLAGLLFAMAPGKGLASAQPRSPPAVASAMLSAPSPLSRTHRGVPVPDDWDDDDVDTSGATERIDVTLPHRPHYGSQQCSSSSPPPQVQGRAHADVAYGSCAHPFQQTQEAAQRAAFSRAAARRALVMGREALVQLRQCLEVAYTQYPWEDVPGALMWCLVVGTYATARVIAATDNNGRGGYDVNDNDSSDLSDAERRELRDCGFYFRRELKRALLSIGLSKWDEMVACLRVWIWLIRCRWKGTIVPR